MFDHLLLPVADTTESRHAVALAVRVADACGATVHALAVREAGAFPASDTGPATSPLDGARSACEVAGVDVMTAVVTGRPTEAVLGRVDAVGADLVVLGARGRRRSVTAAVVRRSPVPVLTVPRPAPLGGARLRRLLLATDGSGPARRARDLAFALATVFDATVHALSVVERRFGRSGPLRDLLDRQAASVGRATRAAAARAGVTVTTLTRAGRPASEILDAAAEGAVDLIVLGTHSRTRVDRLAMGSVAAAVVRDADRPVLTVPSPKYVDETTQTDSSAES